MRKGRTRREFLKDAALGAMALGATGFTFGRREPSFPAPYVRNSKIANKVIVLGMDGMDPDLISKWAADGDLPAFRRLMETGQFGRLQTTMPPQSPVAWASFITGCNPGGHGIFDFIHRDPSTFTPYLSTSRSSGTSSTLDVGHWSIPLGSGKVELMRRGPAFWSLLEERGIPAYVLQIPANFPVVTEDVRAISGMGTPDLLGGYGTYTLFTEKYISGSDNFTSGRVVRVRPLNHRISSVIKGPKNSFRNDNSDTEVEIVINRDPTEPLIRIHVQGQDVILRQGEWSDWVPLTFSLVPVVAAVPGMVRFFAKQVHPHLQVYASPVNIDPMSPSMPICSPPGYSKELAEAVGRFYTQGLPADTKALSEGALSNHEYFTQAKIVLEESMRIFEHEMDRFDEGFFFHYFSTIDQNSHMLWRLMDPQHPQYEPKESEEVKGALKYFYRRMDDALAKALSKVDNYTTFMALSDHGFTTFTREFHVSTWLAENGFTAMTHPEKMHDGEFYQYVDWEQTKAFALGINGIFLNLRGREKQGSISEEEGAAVKRAIIEKLHQIVDPRTGQRVVSRAYDTKEIYSGPHTALAPDIQIGYERGYRSSDESILGKFPRGIIGDRTNKWSADHCMDPARVPGMLITNKRWSNPQPGLWDLAPSILRAFGIEAPREMDGRASLEA